MVIDIVFFIFIAYGFYLGFSRGIIRTAFTILSLTIGVMASLKLAPATTKFLETTFADDNPLMFLAGMLLSFTIVMVILRMIARGLEGILKTANINVINQIMGGVLLSALLVLLYSVLLWFGDQAHMIDKETKVKSITYPYLQQYPGKVKQVAMQFQPMVEEFWDQSLDMMDRLEKISIEQTEKTRIEDRSNELQE
ncbi:MAG: CvpA family protein [Bacteroidota bacterium]